MKNTVSLLMLFLKGICDIRQKEQNHRIVYVNNVKPDDYTDEPQLNYGNNQIITSKVFHNSKSKLFKIISKYIFV